MFSVRLKNLRINYTQNMQEDSSSAIFRSHVMPPEEPNAPPAIALEASESMSFHGLMGLPSNMCRNTSGQNNALALLEISGFYDDVAAISDDHRQLRI